MISLNLPKNIENRLRSVDHDNFNGDLQVAIKVFSKLHRKYGWKEQRLKDIKSVRSEVSRKGGIKAEKIEKAIKMYRKNMDISSRGI